MGLCARVCLCVSVCPYSDITADNATELNFDAIVTLGEGNIYPTKWIKRLHWHWPFPWIISVNSPCKTKVFGILRPNSKRLFRPMSGKKYTLTIWPGIWQNAKDTRLNIYRSISVNLRDIKVKQELISHSFKRGVWASPWPCGERARFTLLRTHAQSRASSLTTARTGSTQHFIPLGSINRVLAMLCNVDVLSMTQNAR